MRPFSLTVLKGGINRLRVKGGADPNQLYDLTNAYITNAGSVVPREGTLRFAALDSSTVGLAAANGTFNIFSSTFTTLTPAGFTLNVLQDPVNTSASITKIWFAKPFMGFEYVVAQFSDGNVFHYWLQNDGTWTSSTVYTSASIVLPPVLNGLAYQGVRDFPAQPLWTPETVITSGKYVEPNSPTGFAYQAVAVAGSPAHTGQTEPIWPITSGATIQEFGDFDQSTSDAGGFNPYTTASPLAISLTDRYGDSATIANSGTYVTGSATLSTLVLASTKIKTWTAGTTQVPGSVVIPTTNQGAFANAIPDGDFSAGTGWVFTDVGGAAEWAFGTARPYVGLNDIEIVGGTSLGSDGAYATMSTGAAVKPGTSVTVNAYVDPNNNGANLELWVQLNWYNAAYTLISFTRSVAAEGVGYRQLSATGVAPGSAAFVAVAFRAGSGTTSRNTGFVGLVSWSLETPAPITNFLFEAIQPTSGITSSTEPAWPTVLGNTVIDGTVTWEAIGTSIITWEAIPLMMSGLTTPSFPTTIGNTVHDYSTFSNVNGYITTTSMSWQATSRQVIDTGDPNTVAVTIGASHVFAGDNDIVDYSAAVNPIDWSSTNNAGYLPTGLNNYGDNPVTALGLYRGNLIVFNAGGYQMWQIDPDPQNMAFLDAQPVGCIWTRSIQSVANDLIFLTEVGVRNLGTIGATANMAIGNTGQPVDPLVMAQFSTATVEATIGGGNVVIGTIADPYWLNTIVLLHFDGVNGQTVTTDSGPLNLPITNTGGGILTSATEAFGSTSVLLTTNTLSGFKYPAAGNVLATSPANLSTGDFTAEGWFNLATSNGASSNLLSCFGGSGGWELRENSIGGTSTIFQATVSTDGANFTQVYGPELGLNTRAANIWYHVALVRSGSTFAVATDGVFGTGATVVGILGTVSSPLYFGYPASGVGPTGFMDEVRITAAARYTPGSNFTAPTQPFDANFITTYDPFTIYYPGRGQYMLIFGPQMFVLTINGLAGNKSWSRYIFPQAITDATLNSGSLFVRTTGNLIWELSETLTADDVTLTTESINIISTMQWPYMDMRNLGINKILVGLDLVGNGATSLQVAYNQQDPTTFSDTVGFATSTGVTTPYFINMEDIVPGQPVPIPINAPSFSLILTFDGGTITTPNDWVWDAANFYINDESGGGATG